MYESLAMPDLRAIAKQRGMKISVRTKKAELIDLMLEQDEKDASEEAAKQAALKEARKNARPAVTESAGNDTREPQTRTGDADRKAVQKGRTQSGDSAGRRSRKVVRIVTDTAETPAADAGRQESAPAQSAPAQTAPAQSAPAQSAPAQSAPAQEGRNETGRKAPAVKNQGRRKKRAEDENKAAQPAQERVKAVEETGTAVPETKEEPEVKQEPAVRQEPAARQETAARQEPAVKQEISAEQAAATAARYARRGIQRPDAPVPHKDVMNHELDSGEMAHGILEVMSDGYGFIRSANYLPGDNDVYVAPSQIRRFNLKTGDIIEGNIRIRTQQEKFSALLFVKSVNGMDPETAKRRFNFEDMTPIFPDEKIRLEKPGASIAMRVMDLMCPVGKGQRGMIVSPPKAGKTTLLKEVARSVKANNPEIHLIILLIDERPEEVTDIREAIEGPNVEVIYSTFDELPDHHKRVAEMVIERAKRLVEHNKDVMILLDSITRLTRAYNLTEPSSGRTLSGGLDPAALHMPKRFFGAARNMREGGSLTILATALIETGSKMDDVVYEEFKGTGNMELILNRKLQERRIFPAIDLAKSGTRRDDLLLTPDEQDCINVIRRAFVGARAEEATESVLDLFARTRTNGEFVNMVRSHRWAY